VLSWLANTLTSIDGIGRKSQHSGNMGNQLSTIIKRNKNRITTTTAHTPLRLLHPQFHHSARCCPGRGTTQTLSHLHQQDEPNRKKCKKIAHYSVHHLALYGFYMKSALAYMIYKAIVCRYARRASCIAQLSHK